jgi:DNA-3-methyladenine glycosylase II
VTAVVTDTIVPAGPFSLRAAAGFGFGPNEGRPPPFDGAMRLAFPLDGGTGYAGVVCRQEQENGAVSLEIHGGGDPAVVSRQVARILSLDHDGDAFLAIGERDPVIGRLQQAHPGQRPVLFHNPYEAAAWTIISARRPAAQGARIRRELASELGATFALAGEPLAAFPQPDHLLAADTLPGLPEEKAVRLRGVAEAALAGRLEASVLQELGWEDALAEVQRLRGVGPFYAGLIVLRATGFADALLTVAEPKVLAHVTRLYGLSEPAGVERFAELAEQWRPFRTWATVLLRLGGDRGAR